MAQTLKEIRTVTDEQLIEWHDELVGSRATAHDYFLQELRARELKRATDASNLLARRSLRLTVVNMALAVAAIAVAIIALVVSRG